MPSLIVLVLLSGYVLSNFYLFRVIQDLRQKDLQLKLLSNEEANDDSVIDFITKHMMSDPRALVTPDDPGVINIAKLKNYDPYKLYDFVKFKVKYDANDVSHESAPLVLRYMKSNCFGNSALLVSLLRASGMKPDEVHVTVGIIVGDKLHAWTEVRSGGRWIMMDPTAMIGKANERWIIPRREFYKGWKVKPEYDFNDSMFRFRLVNSF